MKVRMVVQKLSTYSDRTNIGINNSPSFGYTNMPIKHTSEPDVVAFSPFATSSKRANELKEQGNERIKKNDYSGAIKYYKEAIKIKPDFADAYYNLGKAYKNTGQISKAITTYEKLLEIQPKNIEIMANLGQYHKQQKHYSTAINYFRQAIEIDDKFDLANRELKQTENLRLAQVSPKFAQIQRVQRVRSNLKNALGYVKEYFPPEILSQVNDISFVFDKTSSLGGHRNIAQYENYNKRIVVTDDYVWAAPQLVAAYLVHEIIHGKDKDPYTSIAEEQDAYEESVKFWIQHNNGAKDPEMDYAAYLYEQSPQALDNKVEEIYSSRDGSIPKYSPNHGIASQSLGFKFQKLFAKILPLAPKATKLEVISDNKLYSSYFK